jgi:hypothetical protein
MSPTTAKEAEDFAYTLGEHTQKFANHPHYKTFVKELLSDLCQDLKPAELDPVLKHIERLAAQRAKEEKSGNVTHFIEKTVDTEDDQDDTAQYEDFM